MMTNTYTPIVGGVEKSIKTFTANLKDKGHDVLIAAPEYQDRPAQEENVVRVPSLQKFNGTDFSVNLPVPGLLSKLMKRFQPDIVHSHHPFLMGDVALRMARQYEIPLIFTYHTMFEQYLHYLPIHNEKVKRFVIELSCGYANLTHQVIVPTRSVHDVLRERDVTTPIAIIPTSIDVKAYAHGDGGAVKRDHGIPADAYVIGHVGRLEPEKNLEFLAISVAGFMQQHENIHFLVVGKGSLTEPISKIFQDRGIQDRLHFSGILEDQDLINSYHAMDVFAFSSHSETQGVVLMESMAAGVPIIAVDAPGARDVIQNEENGKIIATDDEQRFIQALSWHYEMAPQAKDRIQQNALTTAKEYSHGHCVNKLIDVYTSSASQKIKPSSDTKGWTKIMNRVKAEWDLLKNITEASETSLRANS
jgi:glycosyltransferase involved in cell wall biosynthesis